nr:hypothetical protein [Pseudonocardia oroxyli]
MLRLDGRTRRARNRPVIAAVGFVALRRLPWRQVTCRSAPRPARRQSATRVDGGSG